VLGDGWNNIVTVEGQIVKMADMIAYVNHDIRDAIRANLVAEDELPISVMNSLGHTSSQMINTLVYDIIINSTTTLKRKATKPTISMSPNILEVTNTLRDFLFERVYNPSLDSEETKEARKVIYMLYNYFIQNSEKLPAEYNHRSDGTDRNVTDYIAGMTDHYAMRTAVEVQRIKQ
jgi:dGTPase